MDETIRVRIVADTKLANNSLKNLSKETKQIGTNTNTTNEAVLQLERTLNSVGFRAQRLKAIGDIVGKPAKRLFESTKTIKTSIKSIVNEFKGLNFGKNLELDKSFNITKYGWFQNMERGKSDILTLDVALRNLGKSSKDLKPLQDFLKTMEGRGRSRHHMFQTGAFKNFKKEVESGNTSISKLKDSFERLFTGTEVRVVSLTDYLRNETIPNVKTFLTTFGNGIKTLLKSIGGLVVKLGVLAAAIGAVLLIKNTFDVSKLGNDIDKTSQKVGMSTNAYQKWAYILERCGIEASNLKTAMRGLTSATLGSNGEYFKQLGIDPNGKSQEKLFEETVAALQKVENSTTRAQLAYKLLGRSSAELAPVLALNSAEITRLSYQYDLLGATMDGRVVKASVNMRDALQDLRAAWQGLKNTLAQGLMPIITNIIVRITVLVAKINMLLQALFGVNIEYENAVDATQTITKNTQATTAAVKKLKTLIAGFDELNLFPSQDNGASIGDDLLDGLDDYSGYVSPNFGEMLPEWAIKELENFRDNVLPGIIEKVEKLKEAIQDINYALSGDKWNDAFDNNEVFKLSFWDMLLDLVGQVAKGLEDLTNGDYKGFFEDFFPVGGELPEEGWFKEWINRVFHGTDTEIGLFEMPGIKEIYNFFDWLLDFDTLNLSDLFDFDWLGKIKDFEPPTSFIEFVDQLFGIDIDWNRGIWKHLMDFANWLDGIDWDNVWNDVKAPFENFWYGVEGFWNANIMPTVNKIKDWNIWKGSWWEEKFTAVKEAPGKAWNSIKQWWQRDVAPKISGPFFKGKFLVCAAGVTDANIPAKIAGVWGTIVNWWKQNVSPKFTASYWKGKWETIKSGLGNTPLLAGVQEKWNGVKTWWETNIAPKFKMDYWKTKFNTIKDGLGYSSVLTSIQEKWNSVKSWWNTNVASKFTWTYWRDKFNSIKTGLSNVSLVQAGKNIINGLINTIETGINRMIDKINSSGIISALKKVGVDITLNRIYIPRLAKGGIIDSPTMAMMGEYPGARSNPEIVTPENKLTEIFNASNDDIVGVLIQGFRQIIQAIDEKDTTIQIGDTTIAKSAARGNNQYRLQTGESLF